MKKGFLLRSLFRGGERLKKDEGGQAIMFVAVLALVIALFVAMVINVGNLATNRIRMQNAADAAAMTAATYQARGLNLISATNTTMTWMLSLIIILDSLEDLYDVTHVGNEIQLALAEVMIGFPPTAVAGAALKVLAELVKNISMPILKEVYELVKSTDIVKRLWDLMDVLAKAQKVIKYALPIAGSANALSIASSNGADYSVAGVAGGLPLSALELPVEEGSFSEVCTHTLDGGEGFGLAYIPGHEPESSAWSSQAQDKLKKTGSFVAMTEGGQGYLHSYHKAGAVVVGVTLSPGAMALPTIAWGLTLSTSILLMNKYNSICDEGGSPPEAVEQKGLETSSCEDCKAKGYECQWQTYILQQKVGVTSSFPTSSMIWDHKSSTTTVLNEYQTTGPRPGSCPPNDVLQGFLPPLEVIQGPPMVKYYYHQRKVAHFESCKIDYKKDGAGVSSQPDSSDKPKPMKLIDDYKDKLGHVFVAMGSEKKVSGLIGGGWMMGEKFVDTGTGESWQALQGAYGLGDTLPGMVTIAQAGVFNQRSEDLFTQDWKAALEKVDLEKTAAGGILSAFDSLKGIFGAGDLLLLH